MKHNLVEKTQTFRLFGNIIKAFLVPLGNRFAVYAYSDKRKKVVNTHVWDKKRDAILTVSDINKG